MKKVYESYSIRRSHEKLTKQNVWFQKITIPPPRRELEIPEGWGGGGGGQWPRKFQRGGGINGWISFQRVNFTFMSDINVQNCNLPTLHLCRSFLKT